MFKISSRNIFQKKSMKIEKYISTRLICLVSERDYGKQIHITNYYSKHLNDNKYANISPYFRLYTCSKNLQFNVNLVPCSCPFQNSFFNSILCKYNVQFRRQLKSCLVEIGKWDMTSSISSYSIEEPIIYIVLLLQRFTTLNMSS